MNIYERYPDASITERGDGFLVERYPLMGDAELTGPQWLALQDIARTGATSRNTRVRNKLVDYGLLDADHRITPAGRDYVQGHFAHGYIPKMVSWS